MILPFPLSQSDQQMQRVRHAVEQHRNAPFRSADWLAGELMTICETAPANDAASPTPSNDTLQGRGEVLARIRTSMALLQQNSEGCALNHYGSDSEEYGMPGWLIDTKADLEKLTDLLAALQKDTRHDG